jgi:hypothetical protein
VEREAESELSTLGLDMEIIEEKIQDLKGEEYVW